jgi:D-beta-D-heptose 7-phosphate kinase/D-beta-D-heptose 1-phosphate adenosyltransferase
MDDYRSKILTRSRAVERRAELASLGRRLVLTNGCFDLLHPGHLRYLDEARRLGDFLLIAVNSDESVRRLKGPERPVRSQAERLEMLAALVMVDAVTIFEEDSPLNLILALKPDFLVKGGDWAVEAIVGGPETESWGGRVMSLSLEPGFSTTDLIARVRGATSAESEKTGSSPR